MNSLFAEAQDRKVLPPNFDAREVRAAPEKQLKGAAAQRVEAVKAARRHSMGKGIEKLKAGVPGLKIKTSEGHGGVEVLSAQRALTGAMPGRSAEEIVREFLRANAPVYGLEQADLDHLQFLGESVNRVSGIRMVRVVQKVNGLPVFQSETRFTLDRDGRIIRSVGALMPDATTLAPAAVAAVSPEQALVASMTATGIPVAASQVSRAPAQNKPGRTILRTAGTEIQGDVSSELVYFPLAAGRLVPAWSQIVMTKDSGSWYTLVDATTGDLLWRKNIASHASSQEARFQVYVQADGRTPSDSPSPHSPTSATPGSGFQPPAIARRIVRMSDVQDPEASPDGWLADGATTTRGNNVDAYLDRDNQDSPNTTPENVLDGGGRPVGNPDAASRNRDFLGASPRNFGMSPAPAGSNPDAGQDPDAAGYNGTTTGDVFRRGLVTQLFYVSNWYHDILYTLGFDEAAGNFQTENFDKGGAGGDEVQAEAQDGSGTDNANFSTPPDGEAGRMQMYLFTGPTPMRDGSLDTEVVTHELTHGLSNRLIANGAGLMWGVGGGMGEGWSDFYAMALLNNTNSDDPDAMYATGGYATYKMGGLTDNYLYGIRRFPYSTDNSINPLTWADVDDSTYDESGGIAVSPIGGGDSGAGEVHAMGEIWALTLWEMRSRIIADPAGANGDVPSGNMTALAIVTDGMKMTPANPSFIEARDAILAADAAANGSRNERWIWEGFADRGLGYNASAPYSRMGGAGVGHIGIGESFDIPYLDVGEVVVEDATLGNGNASLDPNETVDLVVRLKNPWLAAAHGVGSAQASLVAVTPGVTVLHPNSTYPAIPAGEEVGGSPFRVHVPAGASAGMPIRFEITVTSAMGTRKVDFTRRVGRRVGLGTPFVLTRTIPGGLDFMSGEPHGKTDSLTVSEDVEIADLDFRVDDLVHPWVGDVGVMLKGPAGLGTDLILDIGALANDFGAGENLKDTVIDDDAEDDLALAEEVSAPFTGSWKPVFNSNQWDVYGLASDTEGLLSRFNGTSSRGTWTVLVTDKGWFNDGTLNAWSLIITPARYEILPFAGKPDIVIERPAGGGFPRGGVQDFGLTAIGDSTTFDFIMKNVGTADLTSLDFSFDGPDAAMFSAIFSNPGRLRPGEEKAFTLVFSPLDVGMKTAAVHIASNDPDEDPYDMLVTGTGVAAPFDSPEIVVEQPAGVVFPDGGVKTFGNIFVGESKTLDFSLSNIGTVDLTGLQMNINGPDAAMFSVVTPPVAPVSPGGSTTFSLRFTPGKAGTCIAALQIANNDPNEAPFDIALRGVGLANPDLRLQFPAGNDRPAGATVHFGDVGIGAAAYLTFTIVNAGLDNLDGIGVSIDGPDAGLYQLVVPPAATLAPAGSTTFSILFSPLSPGFKQAALHIASNDPDENPFDLTLTGYRYTALEDWRKTHFGITNNTSIAANDADDDHDGIPNLVEFAFGLQPDADSRGQLPQPQFSGESLSISFIQPPGVSGITYGAEWSTVLSNAPGVPVADSGVLPSHTFSVPLGLNLRIYLRLTVTEP